MNHAVVFAPSTPRSAETSRDLDVVVLPVLETVAEAKPVVRIFLGTESAQNRAERVFVWSVMKHRDPGRRYEITLMKDLPGFDRSGWTTGFTNYRFAIPQLAGGFGRAIYNDVDQIYLSDPAALFDLDMAGRGCLSLCAEDTSVMLLDCGAMERAWNIEAAQRHPKKTLIERARGLDAFGSLPRTWNARDEEFVKGCSKLLHFTTLHLQPWAPEPERFAYRAHPHGNLWLELEQKADEAAFTLHRREAPSQRYLQLIRCYESLHEKGEQASARAPEQTFPGKVLPRHAEAVGQLIRKTGAGTILDYGAGKAAAYRPFAGEPCASPVKSMPAWGEAVRVTLYDPGYAPYARLPEGRFDGVICTDVLEHLAEEDVSWILQEMFGRARRFVYASIACYPAKKTLPNGENAHTCQKSSAWWEQQFRSAARAHPHIHWHFSTRSRNRLGRKVSFHRSGGQPLGPLSVWILDDGRPGNTHQAIALAEALGFDYQLKTLRFGLLSALHNRLLGASLRGLKSDSRASIEGPYPDLVLAAGRRTAPVSRWIGRHSLGAARLVQLGRKGGDVAQNFDAVVTPVYCRLARQPNRIETMLPLSPMAISSQRDGEVALGNAIGTLVLVGGATKRHLIDERVVDEFVQRLRRFQRVTGESMIVATSRRTSPEVLAQLRSELRDVAWVCTPAELQNRYLATLESAARVVVTNDSESMIADAVSSGHPVFIYPLPLKPVSWWHRLGTRIDAWSRRQPQNSRSTVRPQSGLEYLCARLIERGFVRPPRDLESLQRHLFELGAARPFDEGCCAIRPAASADRCAKVELENVARRVRSLLALPA